MACYAIYIPKVQGADNAHLTLVGLEELARDQGPEWADVLDGGPDGGRGMLAAWRRGDPAVDPELRITPAQRWTPAKPDPARGLPGRRFWVGVDRERPPRPEELARTRRHPGPRVQLADGQYWEIPAAVRLPHRHGLDEEGFYKRRVDPAYEAFYRRSEEYARQIFEALDVLDAVRQRHPGAAPEQIEEEIPLFESWEYCCLALALNYRVTEEIVDLLGLIDDASMLRIVTATIELPEIEQVRAQKKTSSPVVIPVG